jgi:flagellar motor switch protein FliN/FliY
MNDELLSQDQIDALASGADMDNTAATGGKGGATGSIDFAGLTKAVEIITEQATTVLSTVLSKDVTVSVDDCSEAAPDTIKSSYKKDFLELSVQFTKGFSGQLFFLISKKDTAILADLMMMGDGAAEYEEDHKDAIVELFNQVMGAVNTSFGVQMNMECEISQATVSDFNADSTAIPLAECTSSKLVLKVQDVTESSILMIAPNDISAALAEKATSADNGASDTGDAGTDMGTDNSRDAGQMPSAQFDSFGAGGTVSKSAGSQFSAATPGSINMLLDIQLQVAIELGRTDMSIKRILELGPGSIIELDRMAGEPVDLLVNGKVVAKGEVVVVDENFGIRIVSLVSPEERLKSLK